MAARQGMDPKTWTLKEVKRVQGDTNRFLKIVHSRAESLRRIGRDFGKNTLVTRMKQVKKKVREAQDLMAGLPDELGKSIIGRGTVRMVRRTAGAQGNLFDERA